MTCNCDGKCQRRGGCAVRRFVRQDTARAISILDESDIPIPFSGETESDDLVFATKADLREACAEYLVSLDRDYSLVGIDRKEEAISKVHPISYRDGMTSEEIEAAYEEWMRNGEGC